jgi:two-component system chemotaxis sensor kinase CheA
MGGMPLSQDEQTKYKSLYLRTAREYIKELKDDLNQIGTGGENEEVIDALHRAAHSLSGQSQMMGYQSMSKMSSLMEKIFKAKKEKAIELSDELVSKLISAVTDMEDCLESLDKENKETDLTEILKELQTVSNISE